MKDHVPEPETLTRAVQVACVLDHAQAGAGAQFASASRRVAVATLRVLWATEDGRKEILGKDDWPWGSETG